MRPFLLIAFSFAFSFGYAQHLPTPFLQTFQRKGLDKHYSLGDYLKPSFLQADFNGDGTIDIAALVVEKATKKRGVLFLHGKTGEHFIVGAGTTIDNLDNFSWADRWSLYRKKVAHQTRFEKESGDITGSKEVKLARPAVLIEDYEDGAALAGGLIYWNGKKYVWIHQGE